MIEWPFNQLAFRIRHHHELQRVHAVAQRRLGARCEGCQRAGWWTDSRDDLSLPPRGEERRRNGCRRGRDVHDRGPGATDLGGTAQRRLRSRRSPLGDGREQEAQPAGSRLRAALWRSFLHRGRDDAHRHQRRVAARRQTAHPRDLQGDVERPCEQDRHDWRSARGLASRAQRRPARDARHSRRAVPRPDRPATAPPGRRTVDHDCAHAAERILERRVPPETLPTAGRSLRVAISTSPGYLAGFSRGVTLRR